MSLVHPHWPDTPPLWFVEEVREELLKLWRQQRPFQLTIYGYPRSPKLEERPFCWRANYGSHNAVGQS